MFTPIERAELVEFLAAYNIDEIESFHGVERGSVNSNFTVEGGGEKLFLRVYEEQDAVGAAREIALVAWLAERGIPTPVARARRDGARLGTLAGKPAALFPFVRGEMSCQRGLTVARMTAVGDVLARLHLARPPELWPTRFGPSALATRLDRIASDARHGALAAPLRAQLAEAVAALDPNAPRGLVHGDVFRDNVLWEGERITAVLDFESASEGTFAYDLAVTSLAFGFGDDFEPALVRALFAGYEARRPLAGSERRAIFHEARLAALRFTITRVTDYAMRVGSAMVQKDYRRFAARLARLDAMGEGGFAALTGG
jgi:homoserine kinase type II